MTSTGETQDGNSIEVNEGASVTYSVSKEGYRTQSQTIASVDEDKNINITLVEDVNRTLTFSITPNTAEIEILCDDPNAEITANSVTADDGALVSYNITAEGYQTFASQATLTADQTATIAMLPQGYRAAWSHTESDVKTTIFTNNIEPEAGDDVYTTASGSASDTVDSVTLNTSTGIVSSITVDGTAYERDANEDASSV